MNEDYIAANREAWDEAFEHRAEGWGEDIAEKLLSGDDTGLIDPELKAVLTSLPLKGRHVAQFCCNNGRELMALMRHGVAQGVGFDLSAAFIGQARQIAHCAQLSCTFHAVDLLEATGYEAQFDLVFIALACCWFKDLQPVFQKAAAFLKPGGRFVVFEAHPFTNVLAAEGEPAYDAVHPASFAYAYLTQTLWEETSGMAYVAGTSYPSKPFYAFSHTMADYVNALAVNGLVLESMAEYDTDRGVGFGALAGQGYPLMFSLVARKAK